MFILLPKQLTIKTCVLSQNGYGVAREKRHCTTQQHNIRYTTHCTDTQTMHIAQNGRKHSTAHFTRKAESSMHARTPSTAHAANSTHAQALERWAAEVAAGPAGGQRELTHEARSIWEATATTSWLHRRAQKLDIPAMVLKFEWQRRQQKIFQYP